MITQDDETQVSDLTSGRHPFIRAATSCVLCFCCGPRNQPRSLKSTKKFCLKTESHWCNGLPKDITSCYLSTKKYGMIRNESLEIADLTTSQVEFCTSTVTCDPACDANPWYLHKENRTHLVTCAKDFTKQSHYELNKTLLSRIQTIPMKSFYIKMHE